MANKKDKNLLNNEDQIKPKSNQTNQRLQNTKPEDLNKLKTFEI